MPVDPQRESARHALLEQLAYLVDEVTALQGLVARVPEPVLEGRPLPGEPTLKEMFGLLAACDEHVFLPQFKRMVAEEEPVFDAVDEPQLVAATAWNEWAMPSLLERIRDARSRLVDFLSALPEREWTRTGRFGGEVYDVYSRAYHVTQHDLDVLRTVGMRLHESRLGDRDLPR